MTLSELVANVHLFWNHRMPYGQFVWHIVHIQLQLMENQQLCLKLWTLQTLIGIVT